MKIESDIQKGEDGLLHCLVDINSKDIRAINEAIRKYVQDSGDEAPESTTRDMINMQSTLHEIKILLWPS